VQLSQIDNGSPCGDAGAESAIPDQRSSVMQPPVGPRKAMGGVRLLSWLTVARRWRGCRAMWIHVLAWC
jgi:hypothetical protein